MPSLGVLAFLLRLQIQTIIAITMMATMMASADKQIININVRLLGPGLCDDELEDGDDDDDK